jgi:hypothetical protein
MIESSSRILLASIRNLGCCPCPRCLTPLDDVHNVGTTIDTQRRVTWARVDDRQRQSLVSAARNLIYSKNEQVTSAPVERLLKPTSLVPNTVYFHVQLHGV